MRTRRPKSYDKYVTRMAMMGYASVIMFGKTWPLRQGLYYRIKFNRAIPGDSVIQAFTN